MLAEVGEWITKRDCVMRWTVLSGVALVTAFSSLAHADGLPERYTKAARPCANFGGFYLGPQVGAARYTNHWEDLDGWAGLVGVLIAADTARESTNTKSGFAGGLTAGWNFQARCTVFGVEADYSWSSISANASHTSPTTFQLVVPGLAPDSVSVSSTLKGYGTLRTRTGFVMDNLLLYVTGGLAVANFDRRWSLALPVLPIVGVTGNETFAFDTTRWGWTVGVGTEWSLWGNWSIKSEFLHMGFEKDKVTFASNIGAPIAALASGNKRFESEDSIWVGRIGVNWRFGGPANY
jgi:outer membrane immunogenic protein